MIVSTMWRLCALVMPKGSVFSLLSINHMHVLIGLLLKLFIVCLIAIIMLDGVSKFCSWFYFQF